MLENKKRKTQEIQLVKYLGMMWASDDPNNDVDLCAFVVHDIKLMRKVLKVSRISYYKYSSISTPQKCEELATKIA
ncbi:MAG: hypothetical protein Q8936_19365 [Bacillota bacterium]|nr:hypothetical protein [Bacillota bacterium]